MADVADIDMKGGHAPALKVSQYHEDSSSTPPPQVGGVRQVNKAGRRSESDKTEKPAKATAEDIEEFGEDKKEKQSTAIISGAKTGNNQLLKYL